MSDETLEVQLDGLKAFLADNKELNQYLEQSTGWAESITQNSKKSEKRAWQIAYGACFLALAGVVAVMGLTPFKTVQTEVLVMDRATGTVEPLQALATAQVSVDEVFTKKFINDFLLARENYTFDTAETNYYTAGAFMSPPLQVQWMQYWDQGNPNSPFAVYKKDAKVRITINSITINSTGDGRQNTATVRFEKLLERAEVKTANRWVATLTYKYANNPTDEKLRRINPVGFQVLDYRVDAEIGGESVATAPQGGAPTAVNNGGKQ